MEKHLLEVLSREDLENLLIETTNTQNLLFEDKRKLTVELTAFKILTAELEDQVSSIETAKNQSDRGLDLQIKRVAELENAMKEKDGHIAVLQKIIDDDGIDTSSLDAIKDLHSKQINSLNNTINSLRDALGHNEEELSS